MNNSLKTQIFKVNENIYDYKLSSLVSDLCSIMEGINSQMETNQEINRNEVNLVFKSIVKALETKDYLLIADVLIFQLLPNIELNSKNRIYIQQ